MSQPIRDITELTDSVEMLEKKPPSFMKGFIIFVLVAIIISVLWSYFSKLDIYVKSSAILQSPTSSLQVKSEIPGKVTDIRVKSGEHVKKGQNLILLKNKEIELEKKHINNNILRQEKNISDLRTLKDVLINKTSLPNDISDNIQTEFENFQANLDILQNESEQQLEETNNQLDILNIEDSTALSLKSEISILEDQNKDLTKERNKLLKQKKNLNSTNNSEEYTAINEKVKEIDQQEQVNKKSIKLKQDQISNYQQQRKLSKDGTEKKLKLYQSNLEEKITQYRSAKINELDTRIEENSQTLTTLNQKLDSLKLTEKKQKIIASQDGIIEMPNEIQKGTNLEQGEVLFSISPMAAPTKALLYINTEDINKISKNDKIKYTFNNGKNETFYGKVKQIFHDPITNKKGDESFFLVEGTFKNNNKFNLVSGSTGKGSIIISQQSALTILLEKLEILNR